MGRQAEFVFCLGHFPPVNLPLPAPLRTQSVGKMRVTCPSWLDPRGPLVLPLGSGTGELVPFLPRMDRNVLFPFSFSNAISLRQKILEE